jgi:hypothetical protein
VAEGRQLGDPIVSGDEIYLVESDDQQALFIWQIVENEKRAHPLPVKSWRVHGGVGLGAGQLLLRATGPSGEMRELLWHNSGVQTLSDRGVSYYFTASASSELVVQKNRLGLSRQWDESRPDVIEVRRAPEFRPQIVLADRDADPASPYLGFWNFSVVQGSQWCVIARRLEGEVAVIGDGQTLREVKLYQHFTRLDFFPPALTSDGTVVMRAERAGVHALWAISPAGEVRELLRHGDTVMTDLGVAVLQNSLFVTPVVAQGQSVAVGVSLQEMGSQTHWGQGLLKILVR